VCRDDGNREVWEVVGVQMNMFELSL